MVPNSRWLLLVASPLLTAALWMDDQPSYKPYQAPVLAVPAQSVPVSGKQTREPRSGMPNPVPAGAASLAQGKALFEINCAMCHGRNSADPGPVGRKLTPPPPGLAPGLVQERSDAALFSAITLGFGRMPPFGGKLTPGERWSLVNFLRARQ